MACRKKVIRGLEVSQLKDLSMVSHPGKCPEREATLNQLISSLRWKGGTGYPVLGYPSNKEMNKFFKKALSVLAIFCCLAGSVTTVSASGTGAPHIKFTNEPTNSPDLRVTKKVIPVTPEGAASETQVPEHAKFRFILKLDANGDGKVDNNEIAANVPYTLSDKNGEIVRKSGGRVVEFETDGNGVFELEDGQTATFKNIGKIAYAVTESSDYSCPKKEVITETVGGVEVEKEVLKEDPAKPSYYHRVIRKSDTEEEIIDTPFHPEYVYERRALSKDGYVPVFPVGGSSGTVVPDMETIEFRNEYTPTDANSTVLRVQKTISYPAGYEVPQAIKDTVFWFRLEIADSENREYTVENPVSADVPTVRLTDSEGKFWLCPGETAVFDKVNGEEGYRVEELLKESLTTIENQEAAGGSAGNTEKFCPDGWWPTGAAWKEGDRIPASPVTFNNANTSFRVRKTMDDNTEPEGVEFTFQLVDAQNNPIAGAAFYRYGFLNKNIITPEKAEGADPQVWRTDETTGYFRLKPGEEAVFCGIEPNTSCTVKEIGRLVEIDGETKLDPSYSAQPDQPVKVTSTGLVPTLHFVNSREDIKGTLAVTKYVENTGAEGSLGEDKDQFYFLLYKRLKTTADVRKELTGLAKDNEELRRELVALIKATDVNSGSAGFDEKDYSNIIKNASDDALQACIGKVLDKGLAGSLGWKLVPPTQLNAGEPGSGTSDANQNWYYGSGTDKKEIYVLVNNAAFDIKISDDVTLNHATGDSGDPDDVWGTGEFAIKAGQTAKFSALPIDGQYRVEEVKLTSEYVPKPAAGFPAGSADTQTVTKVIGGVEQTVTYTPPDSSAGTAGQGTYEYIQTALMPQEGLALTFTNLYTPRKVDIEITKIGDQDQPLEGAEFMIYLDRGKEEKVLPPDAPDDFRYITKKAAADGNTPGNIPENAPATVTIPDLKPGATYWLYEEKAPSGYRLLSEPIEIQITQTKDGLKVTIDGDEYRVGDSKTVGSDTLKEAAVTAGDKKPDSTVNEVPNDKIQLTIPNLYFYELPSAGGVGIYWYSIGGMLLMMAAALILYKYKRTGEVQGD